MTNQWRKKCPEGCTCRKHQAHPCPSDCTCSRHGAEFKRKRCEEGCTCGRHRKQSCSPGCTCSRHQPAHNRYTDEQREEARQHSLAKAREYAARRRREDPEYVARERGRSREHGRRYHLKSKFGITLDQWDEMLVSQTGRCYLCSEPLNAADIHIDHSHSCCPGKRSCGACIRGLACRWCNQGVGQFRDDPDRMRRVAAALEEANARVASRQQLLPGRALDPPAGPHQDGTEPPSGEAPSWKHSVGPSTPWQSPTTSTSR